MKYLFLILSTSILLSGELEVDGDLKVTGNIQNQTIDSLLQVIQDLQSQLSSLQGGNRMETRIYEFPVSFNNQETHELDLYDLTGYDLEFGTISIVKLEDVIINMEDAPHPFEIELQTKYWNGYLNDYNGGLEWIKSQGVAIHVGSDESTIKYNWGGGNFSQDLRLRFNRGSGSLNVFVAVTAQFPTESNTLLQDNSVLTKDIKGQ